MLRKRIQKTVIAFLCIIAILTPYTTNVFGAILQEDTSARLTVLTLHEGGEESSGTLEGEYAKYYDTTPYKYTISDTTVFKIVEDGDATYADALYCLDGEKSFPGILNNQQVGIDYKNVADLKDDTNANVVSLGLSNKNYKAVMWILDNMYLRKQAPEQKDEFLTKAFKNLLDEGVTLDEIKATITDDDIEVVQQWAIWNFTNSNVEKYTSFGAVSLLDPLVGKSGSYVAITGDAERQVYANALFNYLVSAAVSSESTNATYPTIANKNLKSVVDGENYKVGPFKVTSGSVDAASYKLVLTDYDGNTLERSKYNILIEGEDTFTDKNVNEIFDVNYYIYLPIKDNKLSGLKLSLEYADYITKASLWTAADKVYQPVVLLTREKETVEDNVKVIIEPKAYDLALRKFVVKVGNDNIDRTPTIDVTGLKDGSMTTAEYKHSKQPVEVKPGETVVYEIRVYNEGDIDGKALKIVDYLPAGLRLADSEFNRNYGWISVQREGYSEVVTEHLKDEVLKAFDKNTMTEPYSKAVQIECVVEDGLNSGKVLTNVAEVVTDDVYDRDSNENTIDFTKIDETYSGNKNNKTDLTDRNYHYAGTEDDDDFEKLVVEGGTFDLSLQKFITKVNKVAPVTSREPKVDVTPLKNGSSKDAKYTTVKTPLTVEQGDIITYKIRVYNEGEISGYAEEVADFLPSGLGFLVNHTNNIDNYWKVLDDVKTVKLESIPNAIDNLELDDFTGVTDLKAVEVVYDSKIVSTKLKSSEFDTKNLIDGFDPKQDTMLAYKDIEVTCVVIDAKAANNNFKNIAEITVHSDEEKNKDIIDRDSVPGTVDLENYPGNDASQDDNDYELLTTAEPKIFDLSLQKVISKLNGKAVERDLRVSKNSKGELEFTHVQSALPVANGDLITYRILVFNEGETHGYAEEIKDNLPDGLKFVQDNETNKAYGWKLYDKNGKETKDLAQAVTVKTDYLSKAKSEDNLIKAFGDESIENDFDGVGRLDYKYVEIVFEVNTTDSSKDIINIAEIAEDADKDGNPVDDKDSTPNNNKDGEDDQDKEKVRLQEFDLSLKKFITGLNEDKVTDREPKVSKGTNGDLVYATNKNAVSVENGDYITYTIRVYNEGDMAGFAKEISDNIPEGLEYVVEHPVNREYGWKLYDAEGKETKDLAKAKSVKTTYLADKLIAAYDENANISNNNPAYKDVQIIFKVIENKVKSASRELINIAEITDDADEKGNPVDDKDSIPNNNKEEEDDLDKEKVYVKYFDLSLVKDLVKVIVIEDGKTREVNSTRDLMKVEIHRNKLSSTTVKFVYNITVKNEGQIEGYATEITDYIPEGLEFIEADNKDWKQDGTNKIKTTALANKLLKPGETASVQVTLKWKNSEDNLGQKVNVAEISADKNDSNTPDVDSTPNNKVMTEDDIDDAPVILSVSTGATPVYTSLVLAVLVVFGTGVALIKKFVLE